MTDDLPALLHGQRRIVHKTAVQRLHILVDIPHRHMFHAVLFDSQIGQLLQQIRERKQQTGGKHIEHRMHHRDPIRLRCPLHKVKNNRPVQQIKQRHKHDRTDQVKIQMHDSRSSGAPRRPHGRQQRRHTGSDILSHDNGHRHTVGHRPGSAQRLQDTHRSRRALDYGRQDDAGDHSGDRTGK